MTTEKPPLPARKKLLWMYERMTLIRAMEDGLIQAVMSGDNVRVGHPYTGEEAVAVGACAALEPDDYVVSGHRSHGHALAKGVDPRRFMAEIYGKATGLCNGRAGEMWMADHSVGFMGCSEVVGGNLPLAAGLALASRTLKNGRVAVCFFGDGASNQGTFHESLNLASIWRLPVIFVCENNLYAESTSVEYAVAGGSIAARGAVYAVEAQEVDGQDVLAVYHAAKKAAARARAGGGPSLLEAKTYRYHGHYFGDKHLRYRSQEEVDSYRSRDCIESFRAVLLEQEAATGSELGEIDARVSAVAQDALAFARQSAIPTPADLGADVYAA